MSDMHTVLQLEWDGDRFEWVGSRCKPAIEAEVSSGSYDAPWIEFGDLDPQELCRRWNYHHRLREALDKATKRSKLGWTQEALDLLAELDNLENES